MISPDDLKLLLAKLAMAASAIREASAALEDADAEACERFFKLRDQLIALARTNPGKSSTLPD